MQRVCLIAVLLLLAAVGAASAAVRSSPDIVVSQVYAGGGNTGASFANDFVELFNRGSATVDVGSWSLQYASAGATSWQATALSGTIAPGRFYLVSLASTAAVGAALPKADTTDTTNLAASGGKVALVRGAAELTCGAAAGSCSKSSLVADLVGYGTATDFEGAKPAPGLDSASAAVRAGNGCVDTDSSASDFTAVAAAPRNSASAARTCAGTTSSSGGDGKGVAVNLDVESALSISLDQPTLSFGKVAPGSKPTPLAERVDGRQQRRGGVLVDRPSLGLRAGRPTAGDLGSATRHREGRVGALGRCARPDPGPSGQGSGGRDAPLRRAPRVGISGARHSGSRRRSPPAAAGCIRRPSPSR